MGYIEDIQSCRNLNSLFELWKNKEPVRETFDKGKKLITVTINHAENYFIADGIVDSDVWNAGTKKKILFVLKEAYGTDWDDNTLATWLRREHPTVSIWPRVARWVYGLQNTTATAIPRYRSKLTEEQHKAALDQIAVLNLKKSDGNSESEYGEIAAYARSDREEIKKEIELIDPDIVVCGYTFGILLNEVYQADKGKTSDNWYYYLNLDGKERLYIDFYHPANHYPDLLNYYGITNIYQQALIEKAQRS